MQLGSLITPNTNHSNPYNIYHSIYHSSLIPSFSESSLKAPIYDSITILLTPWKWSSLIFSWSPLTFSCLKGSFNICILFYFLARFSMIFRFSYYLCCSGLLTFFLWGYTIFILNFSEGRSGLLFPLKNIYFLGNLVLFSLDLSSTFLSFPSTLDSLMSSKDSILSVGNLYWAYPLFK